MARQIYYSEKYMDEEFEYRHVMLPKEIVKQIPTDRMLSELEWRKIGVQQSRGWIHYMIHEPGSKEAWDKAWEFCEYDISRVQNFAEPHILLFRRPLDIGKK